MVNNIIATVPAIGPSPKIKVAIKALTNVGKVRRRLSSVLLITIIIFDDVIFEDAATATGKAKTAPSIEPSNDILMVSNKGFHTLLNELQSGGIILPIIVKNSCILLKSTSKLKPVNCADNTVHMSSTITINGIRERS